MFKRVFTFILIFSSISVLFGQDLNYHLNKINDDYGIDIIDDVTRGVSSFLGLDSLENIFRDVEIDFGE